MGQAKHRGTREQRLAQRLGLVKRSIEDLKQEYNIPKDAKFLGYGVHLEASDEFLSDFDEDSDVRRKMWARTPELAKLFMEFSVAYEVARKCADSAVVGIFENECQIWVTVAQQQ